MQPAHTRGGGGSQIYKARPVTNTNTEKYSVKERKREREESVGGVREDFNASTDTAKMSSV